MLNYFEDFRKNKKINKFQNYFSWKMKNINFHCLLVNTQPCQKAPVKAGKKVFPKLSIYQNSLTSLYRNACISAGDNVCRCVHTHAEQHTHTPGLWWSIWLTTLIQHRSAEQLWSVQQHLGSKVQRPSNNTVENILAGAFQKTQK